MTRYLCISVNLVDELFHGKADNEEAEWPPSPWRLFQSLLSGSVVGRHRNGWPDARADAFHWLEQRDAPLIIAPEVRRAVSYTLYVPNNDSDKVFDRQKRLTTKMARPHMLVNHGALHYLWSVDENEWPSARAYAELLCQEARQLLALGWGIDLVAGHGRILTPEQAVTLTGQRWKPWSDVWLQTGMRRVPTNGSLDDLKRSYESFLTTTRGRFYQPRTEPRHFRRVPYLLETAMPPRPWVAFELRRPNGDWAVFRHVDAAKVAVMLRRLASESANNDSYEFPGGWERYVAGRTDDRNDNSPRFSYLPLPTTRHKHADGLIRRVLIAEPIASNGAQAEWAARRLLESDLVDEHGEIVASLSRSESISRDIVLEAYVDRAKAWSSITPVVLPGFDDGKYEKAKRLFVKALRYCGLPVEAVEDVVLRKAPFWPGSQHPCLYYRPDYLRDFSVWHVHLRFKEEVYGPIAIGSGRYCGLGLFVSNDR